MIGFLIGVEAKYLQRALHKYAEETGTRLELEKAGISRRCVTGRMTAGVTAGGVCGPPRAT